MEVVVEYASNEFVVVMVSDLSCVKLEGRDSSVLWAFEAFSEGKPFTLSVMAKDPTVAGVMCRGLDNSVLTACLIPQVDKLIEDVLPCLTGGARLYRVNVLPQDASGRIIQGAELRLVIGTRDRLKALPQWPQERGEATPPQRRLVVDPHNVRQCLPVLQFYSPSNRMPSEMFR